MATIGEKCTFTVRAWNFTYEVGQRYFHDKSGNVSDGIFEALGMGQHTKEIFCSDAYEYPAVKCRVWPEYCKGDMEAAQRLIDALHKKCAEVNNKRKTERSLCPLGYPVIGTHWVRGLPFYIVDLDETGGQTAMALCHWDEVGAYYDGYSLTKEEETRDGWAVYRFRDVKTARLDMEDAYIRYLDNLEDYELESLIKQGVIRKEGGSDYDIDTQSATKEYRFETPTTEPYKWSLPQGLFDEESGRLEAGKIYTFTGGRHGEQKTFPLWEHDHLRKLWMTEPEGLKNNNAQRGTNIFKHDGKNVFRENLTRPERDRKETEGSICKKGRKPHSSRH